MANILKKFRIPDSSDYYDILKPFGVKRWLRQSIKESQTAYDSLLLMIASNDIVFKRLSELHFCQADDYRCLLTSIPRAKVSTELLAEQIEVDAKVWIEDELQSIQQYFVTYDLQGVIEVIPHYKVDKDIVVFKMQSIYETDIQECTKLLPISRFITGLWFSTILLFIVCLIASIIIQIKLLCV